MRRSREQRRSSPRGSACVCGRAVSSVSHPVAPAVSVEPRHFLYTEGLQGALRLI